MSGYLDSYLIKLGAVVDISSWNRFNYTIRDAEKSVTSMVGNTTLGFIKVEATIVSALSAVGTSLIALADKTAMTDQQYRLFGLRMLMSKESARAFQSATDELGASLDEIAYDPELNRRFQYLYEQNIKLGRSMGSGFDTNMISIRTLRTEYMMLSKELEFLSGGVISKLFDKLGFSSGDLENHLRGFNDWFTENLPKWSDEISTGLIPVWDNWIVVTKDLGSIFKSVAGDFQFFSGILLGDKSIETTNLSMKSVIQTTQDWADALTAVVLALQLTFKTVEHGTASVVFHLGAAKARLTGDNNEADRLAWLGRREDKKLYDDLTGSNPDNPDYKAVNEFLDKTEGKNKPKSTEASSSQSYILSAILKVSKDTGLPADFIYSQWALETGGFTNKTANDFNNFAGIKIPGTMTSKKYGSLNDFTSDYEKTLNNYPDLQFAQNATDQSHALKHGKKGSYYGTDSEANYAAGLERYEKEFNSGGVTIQSLVINVPKALPDAQWDDWVKRAVKDINTKDVRNITAQTAGGAYQ